MPKNLCYKKVIIIFAVKIKWLICSLLEFFVMTPTESLIYVKK